MKVLVINGSPRAKGNSDLLCDEFIRGAKESGNQVEKVSLREKEVHPCKACYACFKTGSCVQKDDMDQIYVLYRSADCIVYASPLYWWSFSAQLKTGIDRLFAVMEGSTEDGPRLPGKSDGQGVHHARPR